MLALRVLLILCGVLIVFGLLGYAMSRDRRWLRLTGYVVKSGLALAALLLLSILVRRYWLL
jgi:hypothetical protein